MKRMTTSLLTLVLLAPAVSAVPVPDRAKEKLEAIKKKLPEVVKKWGDKLGGVSGAEIKLVRQISPTQAKVTILVGSEQKILTVFLRYYDGTWTSTRYQSALTKDDWGKPYPYMENAIHKLMLAIDELGEK